MQAAETQGVTAKKKNNIPIRICSWALTISSEALMMPTLNIIIGILNIMMITLPIAKFLWFNKFIDPEIEAIEVNIGDPIKKLIRIKFILGGSIFNKIAAIGIMIKKGNWRNVQIIIILISTISS